MFVGLFQALEWSLGTISMWLMAKTPVDVPAVFIPMSELPVAAAHLHVLDHLAFDLLLLARIARLPTLDDMTFGPSAPVLLNYYYN
ncbi:hypothetical protein IWW46_002860 [Coemansia sp. RSA 2440]|nr:hypothetical protein IWW46_002860 [Coemansia sp. RSA 2440]